MYGLANMHLVVGIKFVLRHAHTHLVTGIKLAGVTCIALAHTMDCDIKLA